MKPLTKNQLIAAIDVQIGIGPSKVKAIVNSIQECAYKELRKNGAFVVPGLCKMVVVKKKATKERRGINPFTKEEMTFAAKPARKVLKVRPVKAAKDAVA